MSAPSRESQACGSSASFDISNEHLTFVSQAIDSASTELRRLNLEIWNNPELKFKEEKACKLLTEWLQSQGWTVNTGVYGISTAFEARFSVLGGGRTMCYNAEYDALPEIGHACGHNLIATSTLASGVGVASAMKQFNIPGTLVIIGTPAEETGGGKYIMANNGAWKDCDIVIMTHPMPGFSSSQMLTKASWKFRAKFHGRGSHAGAAPWDGANACDAIVMAYNGLALLRQHVKKTESIQSIILEAGKAVNVIPDYSEGHFSLRAEDSVSVEKLRERVIPIFHSAAAATGCTVELFWDALYEDVVNNMALANRYTNYMLNGLDFDPAEFVDPATQPKAAMGGSSDFGNCSYLKPGIQTLFKINATNMPHTPEFQQAAGSEYAHTEALRAGKANAMVGIDVLLNDEFYQAAQREWESSMEARGRR
ncbi:hypothetical protein N7509_002953 [Penicillium cosmopolitanum]|uniref:Peptidase M20 domain-containing protein 2 n=1 Tax=Penicillium cosmopolitanum TaxID=1131564 RepID=A0A9W9W9R8_9EURO|nr:uncharacterized protein N7509_002953 [Penicillium cosmopolitanum]KAJ5409070.1 hypothetical protein N7509_002953 [Penicillium cosmopolitanum]